MVATRHDIADFTAPPRAAAARRSWIAVVVLCLGQLMLTLDATVANVALPAIQRDLQFSPSSLAWVMNGYLITFGGVLLLAGRSAICWAAKPSSWPAWLSSPRPPCSAGWLPRPNCLSPRAACKGWPPRGTPR